MSSLDPHVLYELLRRIEMHLDRIATAAERNPYPDAPLQNFDQSRGRHPARHDPFREQERYNPQDPHRDFRDECAQDHGCDDGDRPYGHAHARQRR